MGGSLDLPGQVISFSLSVTGAAPQVVLYDFSYGAAQEFRLGAGSLTRVDSWVLGTGAHTTLDVAGYGQGALAVRQLQAAETAGTLGQTSAVDLSLDSGANGQFTDQAAVLSMDVGTTPITFVAAADGQGITAFRIDETGAVQSRRATQDTSERYLAGVSDMAGVSIDGQSYLYAVSALEHGLSGWRVGADGSLQEVVQIGQSESLPVQALTGLATGASGGTQFLVAAAAGTSSLTVFEIGAGGTLGVTDHAVDSLATRFAAVSQLEVVSHADRLYVLATGSDDGISLFAVTGEGRLVHLHSLADSAAATLGGVSGLAAVLRDGGIDVLTTAAHEAGMSLFRVELPSGVVQSSASGTLSGGAGDDMLSLRTGAGRIEGGAGDDLISDGAGSDTLSGGSGADVFVLTADGQRDVITDITPGQDRLDLSAWPMLYSVGQLTIEETAQGAVLRFGAEELELRSADGSTLNAADVAGLVSWGASHFTVDLGPLEVGEPDPVLPPPLSPKPDPDPDPEPEPDPGYSLIGGAGDDSLQGGTGNDYIDGAGGNDTLMGSAGNDGILAGTGDDLVYAGAGDDNVPGKAGNDTLYGEDGNDQLGGSDGFDLIYGGAGNDLAGGGNQDDTMDAGPGNDWFSGGWGNDLVMGNTGDDKLAGSYDNDTVMGGDGNDSLGGGMGRDELRGGVGHDVIGAGEDNDTLYGEAGNDSLGGADGDDLLRGGAGDDTLNGAHGNDTMTGGGGEDVFLFNNYVSSGTDVIRDFEPGSDHLRLIGLSLGPEAGRLDKLNPSDGSHQGVSGTWVEFGSHRIFLDNVEAAALSLTDFLFS